MTQPTFVGHIFRGKTPVGAWLSDGSSVKYGTETPIPAAMVNFWVRQAIKKSPKKTAITPTMASMEGLEDVPRLDPNVCILCGKSSLEVLITRHHLIPRSYARKKNIQGIKSAYATVPVCRGCHDFVHQTCSHSQLATHFNTPGKLKERFFMVKVQMGEARAFPSPTGWEAP